MSYGKTFCIVWLKWINRSVCVDWFVSSTFFNRWVRVWVKAVISQCWRKLSHCLFLALDFKLFIGQLSHCPLLHFWNKFCVCSRRWMRWSPAPPTWTFSCAVWQRLPSSKPSCASSCCITTTMILSWTHFSHASAAIQGFVYIYTVCVCVIEPRGSHMNPVVWVVSGLRANID